MIYGFLVSSFPPIETDKKLGHLPHTNGAFKILHQQFFTVKFFKRALLEKVYAWVYIFRFMIGIIKRHSWAHL